MGRVRVTVWNEFIHERRHEHVRAIYPDGIHVTLAEAIGRLADAEVRTATLDQPHHGLPAEVVDATDTLVWWGHLAHPEVSDEVVDRVQRAVLGGMGLVVLHSGHASRPFRRLMGTACSLRWREDGSHERLWNLRPGHPVLDGIGETIELDREEMYGERFDIPGPDELLMLAWYPGGEVFRSLCTWQRGLGRVVYFQPGHQTHPSYHHPEVQRVIANACAWAAARAPRLEDPYESPNAPAREPRTAAR